VSHPFRVPETFRKRASKKPKAMQDKIALCIRKLVENPRDQTLRVHKMKGREGIWEAYVDNDGNRITFEWDGPTIVLRNNCNHDMLYRNP
jgi:mRNA-degrading endonuclease YafQ of YafQ-DinJ toxin-antitoxin module